MSIVLRARKLFGHIRQLLSQASAKSLSCYQLIVAPVTRAKPRIAWVMLGDQMLKQNRIIIFTVKDRSTPDTAVRHVNESSMIRRGLLKAAPMLGVDREDPAQAFPQSLAIVSWCVIAFFVGMFARETFEATRGDLMAWLRSDQTAMMEIVR